MVEIEFKVGPRIRRFIASYLPYIIAYELSMALLLLATIHLEVSNHAETTVTKRWGPIPTTQRCNKQQRIATLLAFLLGGLGVDHWYTYHWTLAAFKMVTLGECGIWWAVDIIMWIIGGVYGARGCPGGYGGTLNT